MPHRGRGNLDLPKLAGIAQSKIDVLPPLPDEGKVKSTECSKAVPGNSHVAAPGVACKPRELPCVGRGERGVTQRPANLLLDHRGMILLGHVVDRAEEQALAVIDGTVGRDVFWPDQAVGIEEHEQVTFGKSATDVAGERRPKTSGVPRVVETARMPKRHPTDNLDSRGAPVADDNELEGLERLAIGVLENLAEKVGPPMGGNDDAGFDHAETREVVGSEPTLSNAARPPFLGNHRMKLFIGTPCYGGVVTRNYLLSILQLNAALAAEGIPFSLATLDKESLITRARNRLAHQFLQSDATHLLFIDADIRFGPEAVLRLVAHGGSLVAGAVPKKVIDWDRLQTLAGRAASGSELQGLSNDYAFTVRLDHESFDHESFDRHMEKGFVRVTYVGTAFMLIARAVFEAIDAAGLVARYSDDEAPASDAPSIGAYFDTLIHPRTRRYLSEDFAFCHHWRSTGGEVWVDVQTPLGHEGNFMFEGRPDQVAAALGRR